MVQGLALDIILMYTGGAQSNASGVVPEDKRRHPGCRAQAQSQSVALRRMTAVCEPQLKELGKRATRAQARALCMEVIDGHYNGRIRRPRSAAGDGP